MKKKLLYVVHNTISNPPFGGLEIHQDTLANNVKDKYEIYFLYSIENPEKKGRIFVFSNQKYEKIESIIGERNNYADYLSDRKIEKWFSQILVKYSISLVHFFHFINNVPSLGIISKAMGIPYVVSIHDFYVVCRYFTLMDYRGKYCNVGLSTNTCDACLRKRANIPEGSQASRRDFYRRILENAGSVIYMSKSTKDKVEEVYPSLKLHHLSRVHGAPLPVANPVSYRPYNQKISSHNQNLSVVVPGNLALHKGGIYLIECIKELKNEDIQFHFWGSIDGSIKKMLEEIAPTKVSFNGRYDIGKLPYYKYDLSLHLSVWPETYCQTLSEAWAARLIPICTNIGAFSNRVQHGINGFLVDYENPMELVMLFRDLIVNKTKINIMREYVDDTLFLNQAQHADMYIEAYEKILISDELLVNGNSHRSEGFGLNELHIYTRRATWHHVGTKHPEDSLIVPNLD